MALFETFSDRQRRKAVEEQPQTYAFDELPVRVRGQVAHILDDFSKQAYISPDHRFWNRAESVILKTKGPEKLSFAKSDNSLDRIGDHIRHAEFEDIIDMIEVCFMLISGSDAVGPVDEALSSFSAEEAAERAVADLNVAFQRASVGYQFDGGQLNRVDDFLLHAEIVEPAIKLLYQEGFESALNEYMSAHKNYREGNNANALTDANNAFESTMKIICAKRGIVLVGSEKADDLVKKMIDMGYIPTHVKTQFDGLRSMLNGLPVLRNRTAGAGHGAGTVVTQVADHVGAYSLHLAAANIMFLIKAWQELERRQVNT